MARNEGDREDLLLEAVSLIRRIEIQAGTESNTFVIGFRATGWLSIYFGQDLMYQFDEAGQFRRGYVDRLLYRTQGNTLAQLHRQRSSAETTLLRQDLTGESLDGFRRQVLEKIRWLQALLQTGDFKVLRQIADSDLVPEITTFLDRILSSPAFLAPAIKR